MSSLPLQTGRPFRILNYYMALKIPPSTARALTSRFEIPPATEKTIFDYLRPKPSFLGQQPGCPQTTIDHVEGELASLKEVPKMTDFLLQLEAEAGDVLEKWSYSLTWHQDQLHFKIIVGDMSTTTLHEYDVHHVDKQVQAYLQADKEGFPRTPKLQHQG